MKQANNLIIQTSSTEFFPVQQPLEQLIDIRMRTKTYFNLSPAELFDNVLYYNSNWWSQLL